MRLISAVTALVVLFVANISYAQSGNFLENLAKGLDKFSKDLEAASTQSQQNSSPSNQQRNNMASKETTPLVFKNSTGSSIIGFQTARPSDQYFSDNLISDAIQANTTFTYNRNKEDCLLNFRIRLANSMEKQIRNVDVCKVEVVDIDSKNLIRSRNAQLSSVASTIQSNFSPNGNLTVAIRVSNANPACKIAGRINIPKSGWDVDFDNNYVMKLRAKNPEKYGYGDIYGIMYSNNWNDTKNGAVPSLNFLCAE